MFTTHKQACSMLRVCTHSTKLTVSLSLLQSTSPSHSLPSNYQTVLALMKYHSPVLCGAAAAANIKKRRTAMRKKPQQQRQPAPPRPTMSLEELQGLLTALEEEFGRLTL